jgi:hypothetical protein
MGLPALNMPVSMGMAASMGYLPGGTNSGGGAMTATTTSPRLGGFGNGRRSNPQAVAAIAAPDTGFGNGLLGFIDPLTPAVPGFGPGGGVGEMSSFEEEMKQIEQRDQQLLFGSGGCLNDDEEDGY